MLTVIVKSLFAYYGKIFEYYGALFDVANKKFKAAIDENDHDEMKFWREVCCKCILKRQKALNVRLRLRGYYI